MESSWYLKSVWSTVWMDPSRRRFIRHNHDSAYAPSAHRLARHLAADPSNNACGHGYQPPVGWRSAGLRRVHSATLSTRHQDKALGSLSHFYDNPNTAEDSTCANTYRSSCLAVVASKCAIFARAIRTPSLERGMRARHPIDTLAAYSKASPPKSFVDHRC